MSRILIIEDEVEIADLEKDYLELSGFEVEIENDGTVGLKRALTEDFDMYILDLMLPGIDGFEICKQIREEKNTPILMVSAKKDDIDKIRGLATIWRSMWSRAWKAVLPTILPSHFRRASWWRA